MIKAPQDFWSGLVFLVAGLVVLAVAWDYPVGSAARMSYGYFPMMLGGALCLLGVIIGVRSFITPGEPAPRLALRPMLPLAAVAAFGFLLQPAGMALATMALIGLSLPAARDFQLRDFVRLSVVLIPFNWLIFIWALGLPLQMLPGG